MNFTILRFDTLDSTNNEAASQARQGAAEGLCVIAKQQTAGRGRHGRSWVSDPGAGLYFSVVLRPKIEPRFLSLITLMAGVAVYDTLQELGLKPDIKWVNDVLIGEKKISGILAETIETQAGLAIILGIGINLTSRGFPDEIATSATSVETEIERKNARRVSDPGAGKVPAASGSRVLIGTGYSVQELTEATLTKYLGYWYELLNGPNGRHEILDAWRARSSYFSGKNVRVTLTDRVVEGVTDGVEPNGALRLRVADGLVVMLQAGEIERLRTAAADIH